jgi:hypothetical protein
VKYSVLSLSPPYGTLVALRLKKIETRGWQTRYRGPLLIHQTAAPGPKGTPEAALWDLCLSEPFRTALPRASPSRLPRGKIVALVELVDCVPTAGPRSEQGTGPKYADWVHELSEAERAFGDYSAGRWAWLLDNVRPLPEPIAARGMPGLWSWEGELGI